MAPLRRLWTASTVLIPSMRMATLAYIGLPCAIWVLCWLRTEAVFALALVGIWAIASALRQNRAAQGHIINEPCARNLPFYAILGFGILAACAGLFSGAGGFAYQNPDWYKHFAVLRDLIEFPWPVVYRLQEGDTPLVYYLAYYLPAAVAGKLFGWKIACLFLAAWTAFGLFLAGLWFMLLVGNKPVLAGFWFLFANGLDLIGDRLVTGGAIQSGTTHLDWWAGWLSWNFPGHVSQLVWAPQHSLATWCATGMFAHAFRSRENNSCSGLLVAFVSFWTPFAVFGLAPFLLLETITKRARGLLQPANIAAAILLMVTASFFASHKDSIPHDFIWNVQDLHADWNRFMLFHLLEWGIFFLFGRELLYSADDRLRLMYWVAAACLACYPFYRMGIFNDWCMRSCIPSLFLLWTGVGRSIFSRPFNTDTRILLLLALLGGAGAAHEISRSWSPLHEPPPKSEQANVPFLAADIGRQYLGDLNSFFFRHLARSWSPSLVHNPEPPKNTEEVEKPIKESPERSVGTADHL